MVEEYLVCMDCKDGLKLTEYDNLPQLVESLDDNGKVIGFTQAPKDDRKDFFEAHKLHESKIQIVYEKQRFPVSALMSYVEVTDKDGNSFYINHSKERPDLEKTVKVLGKGHVVESFSTILDKEHAVDKEMLEHKLESYPSFFENPGVCVKDFLDYLNRKLKLYPEIVWQKLNSSPQSDAFEEALNRYVLHFGPEELVNIASLNPMYKDLAPAFDIVFLMQKKVVFLPEFQTEF